MKRIESCSRSGEVLGSDKNANDPLDGVPNAKGE